MGELSAFRLMSHIAEAEGLAIVEVASHQSLVKIGVSDGAAHWPPYRNMKIPLIHISNRLSPQLSGIVLAHELGHVVDWRKDPLTFVSRAAIFGRAFKDALKDPNAPRIHEDTGQSIYDTEKSAWNNARLLASEATHWVGRPVDWSLWETAEKWALAVYRNDINTAVTGAPRVKHPDLSEIDPNTKPRVLAAE